MDGKAPTASGLKQPALGRAVKDLKELDRLDGNGKLTDDSRGLCATAGLLSM